MLKFRLKKIWMFRKHTQCPIFHIVLPCVWYKFISYNIVLHNQGTNAMHNARVAFFFSSQAGTSSFFETHAETYFSRRNDHINQHWECQHAETQMNKNAKSCRRSASCWGCIFSVTSYHRRDRRKCSLIPRVCWFWVVSQVTLITHK